MIPNVKIIKGAPFIKPKVKGFMLVVAPDGRVKVDNWNALSYDEQRAIAEFYLRGNDNGCDS